MADFNSSQIAGLLASPKVFAPATDFHGKIRVMRFDYTQSGAGADGDRIVIADLPKGRIRFLGIQSIAAFSALGAARVMAVGWDAYLGVDSLGNPETIAADQDGLAAAIDVSAAGTLTGTGWNGTPLTADKAMEFRSREGVIITAQITGGTIPDGMTLNGYLAYTCE